MNVPGPDTPDTIGGMPSPFLQNRSRVGKFNNYPPGLQSDWPAADPNAFNPNSPLMYGTPTAPELVKSELISPESFEIGTVSPSFIANTGDSPLLDDVLDYGEMQDWKSLFNDEDIQQSLPEVQVKEGTQAAQIEPSLVSDAFNFRPEETAPDLISQDTLFPDTPELENLTGTAAFDFSMDFSSLKEEKSPSYKCSLESAVPKTVPSSSVGTPASSPMISTTSSGRVTKAKSTSPRLPTKKVDDLGITVYKRKPRSAPLKPVEIPEDSNDVAVKRAKNTEAARRSRARKLERMSQLEARVRELIDENAELRAQLSQLKGE